MARLYLSDENLMAYADGQADKALVSAVEAAMFNDADIVARIAAFIRSRRMARDLFLPAEPVEPTLVAAVLSAAEGRKAEPGPVRRAYGWRGALPLAAGLALCLCAGAIGYALNGSAPAGLALLEEPAAAAVLDTELSGGTGPLGAGQLRVLATQRLADGRLCREIRFVATDRSIEAVNCRDGSGAWRVAIALSEPLRQGYAPASGETAIDLFLKNSGAGPALSGEDERQAISSKPATM